MKIASQNYLNNFYFVFLALLLIFPCAHTFGQSNTTIVVSGKVTDDTNQAIPSVNVLIKGTQNGVTTDFDGHYEINVAPDAVLQFSFVGYQTKELAVNNKQTINVKLTELAKSLDEIVVIGYGTTTKKELTGAVTTVKSEDFNKGVYTNPMGLIQGKVAGLSITKPDGADPMSGYQILLRGTNTLTSGQGPLIIIDGMIGADLKNVNFQDVESFDVLKDGSAAAIYGTRGSNGVIIITTKAAKKGKGTFEFSSQVSTQVAPRSTENLSADEFKYAIENYQPAKSGSLFGSKTNWFKEITRETPMNFQNHLAFSGGTDTFSQRLSLTHMSNQGLLQKNETENLILKANIIQKVFDNRLTFDFNLVNNSRTYSPADYSLFRQAFIQNPTQPVYDNTDPTTGGYSYQQGLEYYNPVAMLNERTRTGKTDDLLLSLRTKLKITDYLSWENFISQQKSDWEDNSYKTKYYPTLRGVNGEAEIANGRNSNSQLESILSFNKTAGKHNFQAIAGYSYQKYEMNSSYVGNSNFDTDLFLYNNIAAGTFFKDGQGDLGSYKESSTLIAFFGRMMYNFDNKYLASASIRDEGSSKFGEDNKWGLFPSLSVGWRISEEDFMKDITWLNDLKLRVGYGVTGNQDFSPYRSQLLLKRVGSIFYNQQWINSYGPGQNPNTDLRWEKKQELNLGLDFATFNKRFSGSIEYYIRKTNDLLWEFQVSVPPYLYPTLFTNVGTISNRGIEVTFNGTIIKNNDFQWNSTLTASHNKNFLDKISNAEFKQTSYDTGFVGGGVGAYTQRIQEGTELGTFYGPVWLGVDEFGYDIFKNQNPVGEVDKNKWEKIGTANPDAIIGWSNDFTYKNWNLGFAFRGGVGGKVLNSYRLYYESWNSIGLRNIVHTQLENPNFTNTITYSSKYLEDASFIKLDNIALNYNFNIVSKYISSLNVFGAAQNVFWLTKYKGIDPEVNQGGLEPGIDGLSYYPRTTSISIGLKAIFK